MSLDMARRRVASLRADRAALETKRSEAMRKANRLRDDGNRILAGITKTTSASMVSSKQRSAKQKFDAATKEDDKAADLESAIARKTSALSTAQAQVERLEGEGQRKRDDADKRGRAAEVKHQKERERQERRLADMAKRRQQEEMRHERQVTSEVRTRHFYASTVPDAVVRQLPETIKVLFFASNPRDESQVSLDEEVRDITQRIRMAEYRDQVQLVTRWATRPLDVLQAVNEEQPHVIHFSGHGTDQGDLVFMDEAGNAKDVAVEAVTAMLAATAQHLRLVVFNTCYSKEQAEALAEQVEVAIGMNDAISDDAARVFAAQFYSAIGFGYSVRRAYDQAVAALLAQGIPEHDTPELFEHDGIDADTVILVRPAT